MSSRRRWAVAAASPGGPSVALKCAHAGVRRESFAAGETGTRCRAGYAPRQPAAAPATVSQSRAALDATAATRRLGCAAAGRRAVKTGEPGDRPAPAAARNERRRDKSTTREGVAEVPVRPDRASPRANAALHALARSVARHHPRGAARPTRSVSMSHRPEYVPPAEPRPPAPPSVLALRHACGVLLRRAASPRAPPRPHRRRSSRSSSPPGQSQPSPTCSPMSRSSAGTRSRGRGRQRRRAAAAAARRRDRAERRSRGQYRACSCAARTGGRRWCSSTACARVVDGRRDVARGDPARPDRAHRDPARARVEPLRRRCDRRRDPGVHEKRRRPLAANASAGYGTYNTGTSKGGVAAAPGRSPTRCSGPRSGAAASRPSRIRRTSASTPTPTATPARA